MLQSERWVVGALSVAKSDIEMALVENRAEVDAVSVIVASERSDTRTGVDADVGIRVGQSRLDPDCRKGLSLASIKQRLSREGLGT